MNTADLSRLEVRMNMSEVGADLFAPVVNAAIVQEGFQRALVARRTGEDVSASTLYAPIYFGKAWLTQLRDFEGVLREIATDDALTPAAKVAADRYRQAFPGVATKPILKFVSASDDHILASGPSGWVEIPISADAVRALEEAAVAFVEALPNRATVRAAG